MVRQGALASFIAILAACSPDVDDPANFTVGNTNGNSASGTGGTTDGESAEATTQVAEGSASATSSTGGGLDTSGGPGSTGPVAEEGPVGNCGNGVIDAGEQCDGGDLQGFDCASLGLNGGTLACDPMMCTFDTSMCSSTTGGTSG